MLRRPCKFAQEVLYHYMKCLQTSNNWQLSCKCKRKSNESLESVRNTYYNISINVLPGLVLIIPGSFSNSRESAGEFILIIVTQYQRITCRSKSFLKELI